MGRRRIGQGSLAEALLPAGAGSNRRLERIAGLIDWTPLERRLALLRAPRGGPATRRWCCSARCCRRNGISFPIRALRKRWPTGCRSTAFAASAWMTGRQTRSRCAGSVARRPLAAWQRWINTALVPIRSQVERAIGTLKRSYGWRRVRYGGLLRNGAHLHLLCTDMNRRRAERLLACHATSVRGPAARHRNRTQRSLPGRHYASITRSGASRRGLHRCSISGRIGHGANSQQLVEAFMIARHRETIEELLLVYQCRKLDGTEIICRRVPKALVSK